MAREAGQRGTVAVSAVLMLVILQLMFVSIVLAGARDQDMTVQRTDSARAFYACDAGAHMAIREVMNDVDEDGDGTIGSISDDGNPANDPVLLNARVMVSRGVAGSDVALTSFARCGDTRRRAEALVQNAAGGASQTIMVAWGRSGSTQPRFSTWNGTSWSSATSMPSVGSNVKWVRMKICPTRNETLFVSEDEADDVNVIAYNGKAGTWGAVHEVTVDTGGTNDRPEDVAYEQLSSDGLSAYWKGTAKRFAYRTYNGTSFSTETQLNSPFSTECDYLTLYARPATNDIMMLAADGVAGGPLVAARWNGSSFSAFTTLCTSLASNNEECYSMAYECQSLDGLAVYSQSGQNAPRYRTWNGSSWSSQANLPSIGGEALWIKVAANPNSDQILMVALDANNDLNANVWNGSSWGTNVELETNCPSNDRRHFDLVFERETGKAILVYAESGSNSPRYRTWSGSAWSSEQSAPSIGSTPQIVHLARGANAGEAFAAISDNSRRLHVMRWNGTTMSSSTIVETSLAGTVAQQSFSLPEPTPMAAPAMRSWAEIEP